MGSNTISRRDILKGSSGVAAVGTLAGCTGLTDGVDSDTIRIPGIYDISGPTSGVGRPTAIGSRDAMRYVNENDVIDREIDHPWNDYAYEVPQAQQYYDEYTSNENPPAIVGWGTADTEALSGEVASDEIVYVSASYSANLLNRSAPYNFFGNLDYTSQARAHLEWIAENDAEAKVAFVFPNNPFGQAPVEGGKEYADEVGLDVGPDITLPLTADSATDQLRTARDDDVDYLIHQNTTAPMQVLLSDRPDVYPDVTVCGLTYTVDELRLQQSPDVFEGVRYVNAFRSFAGALDEGGEGADMIEANFDREGRSMDDPGVANLNYVRGCINALLVVKGIRNAIEQDLDPTAGSDVREGMFAIENDDVWGIAQPFDYTDGDRRPTMTGWIFQVDDGDLAIDTTIELSRGDG